MVLEIVGWDTSKRSAKSSSVRLWRRVRRVIFRAVVRVANCWWVSPVVHLLCNGSSGLA